jgi:hypothetical protein
MSTLTRTVQADIDRVATLATQVGAAANAGDLQELSNCLRQLKTATWLLRLDASHLYHEQVTE